MRTSLNELRLALVVLLVGSAVLFAVGTTIERSQRSDTPAASEQIEGSSSENGESGENGESRTSRESGNEGSEQILGIDTESVPLTIAAVLASLLLAAAVWRRMWSPLTLYAVVGFGLLFAGGDLHELVHQLDESNGGLAVIAGVLALMHLAIAGLALILARRDRSTRVEAAPTLTG